MASPRERANYIDHRATELAASGLYKGWLSIEHSLIAEGYPEARVQLSDPGRRERLDRVCAGAISRKAAEIKPKRGGAS